jgi:hypothetical protein
MQEERARNHNIRKLWAPRFWPPRLHFGQQRLLPRFSVLALHLLSNTHPPSEASHCESENSHHRLTRGELETMISANFGHRVLAFAFATFSEQRLPQRFGVHALHLLCFQYPSSQHEKPTLHRMHLLPIPILSPQGLLLQKLQVA